MIISPFRLLSSVVTGDFYELKGLAHFIESSIENELKWWSEFVDEKTRDMSPEDASEFAASYAEEYHMVDSDFRLRLRYSLAVTTYGTIESRLNRTCRTLKGFLNEYTFIDESDKILLELDDITADSIVQRARKYLERVLLLEFPSRSRGWQEVLTLAKIRNLIVHSDGYVRDGSLDSYAGKHPKLIEINEHGRLLMRRDYNEWVIEQCEKLFSELYQANKGRYNL